MNYSTAIRDIWKHRDLGRARSDFEPLVHYATLAASSHNTQPWIFELGAREIKVRPDLTRRCPEVDPDDHHLFVSLGCAVENLAQAARAAGLQAHARYESASDCVRVDLERVSAASSDLFLAILERRCTRARFERKGITPGQWVELERVARGFGIDIHVLTARQEIERIVEFVAAGNDAQFASAGWAREMRKWIRFNDRDALRAGDGLYGRHLGIPSVPAWLGRTLMPLVATSRHQNDRDADHLRSSAGLVVFSSARDDRSDQVEVGRCYERFALRAASLGLTTAFVNQPVEVPALRQKFAAEMGLGTRRPDLVVRIGYGPPVAHSLRRPLQDVIARGAEEVRWKRSA